MRAFTNGTVYRYDPLSAAYSRFPGLICEGSTILSLDPNDAGAGVERIDLQGATVLPAFADCHVHLTDTGYFVGPRDLSGVRTYDSFVRAVGQLPRERYILAGQYDDALWEDRATADAKPLDRFFADALAMLVRIDGHSAIVNRKTLGWLKLPPNVAGLERGANGAPTGKLFFDANWIAQAKFMASIPLEARRDAERRAAELALSRGYLHLHVQLVGFAREQYAAEITALAELPKAKWYPKICEPDAKLAHELGLPYVGGDVFLDGSIGSCTAAVSEPFASGEVGALRMSDEDLFAYFSGAEELGISAGVHAIGDRAIEQCIATWERVFARGRNPSTRHFIEHFEIARADQIERCANLRIYLSMQPQFDELWGGKGRMYDRRLGTERMRSMNALRRIAAAGAILCGGDDSPVCELSPLRGMQAVVDHHEPSERLTPPQALTMYTYNAALLAHAETRTGILAPGRAADFVLLDRDPLNGSKFTECTVLQTWGDGELRFPASEVSKRRIRTRRSVKSHGS